MKFPRALTPYEAVYHSDYDSYYWYTHFGDPGFVAHAAIAKLYGLLCLQFADNRVLPFDIIEYATALQSYVQDLKNFTSEISFDELENATEYFAQRAQILGAEAQKATNYDESISDDELRSINDRLMLNERNFLSQDPSVVGTVNWFRHTIFRPSSANSYSGTAFGSLTDLIIQKNYAQATYVMKRIALIINGAAEFLGDDIVFGA